MKKIFKTSALTLGTLTTIVAPIATTISCGTKSSQTPVFTIHLDAYYKHSPYWKSVIAKVKQNLASKGLSKFEIKYTEQETETFTKDKITQLGFTDKSVPDIFKLEYGDISTFNNQKIIMPFTSKMTHDLHLDINEDRTEFVKEWGSDGVDKAIRRDEYNRRGQKTGNQVVVGMPYSINSSVMMVRNGVDYHGGKKQITKDNVISELNYLRSITFNDTNTTTNDLTSGAYDKESDKIPAKYSDMFKITQNELSGNGAQQVVIDQYGKHVFIAKKNLPDTSVTAGTIVRFDGEKAGAYVVEGVSYSDETALLAKFGAVGTNLDYLTSTTPSFFSRNDLWSELGQFLSSAMENDKNDSGRRSEFFWKTVENPTSESQWKHLFSDVNNQGARKAWRFIYDAFKIQSAKDSSWFDPNQATDTSFYNMTHGSRTFPITGIWDLGIAERKYAEYVFGVQTDEDLYGIKNAVKNNPAAKAEVERILDESTKTIPLTDFVGYNNLPIKPFMQVSSIVVNNRINMNPKVWNPSIRGNDGNTYSKLDVIEMILQEFTKGEHVSKALESQMVVPVAKDLRDASKTATFNTTAFHANNFKEYISAEEKILTTSPAGPQYQFYYTLQDAGQKAITANRDLAATVQSSASDIDSKIAKQKASGIFKGIINNESPIITDAQSDKQFAVWYSMIMDQMNQLISNQWKLLQTSGKEFY